MMKGCVKTLTATYVCQVDPCVLNTCVFFNATVLLSLDATHHTVRSHAVQMLWGEGEGSC